MRYAKAIIFLAASVAVTACTSSPDDSGNDSLPEDQFVAIDMQLYIDDAIQSRENNPPGVSDLQLEALLAVVDAGEMSYETYSEAVDRTIQCLEDAGYSIIDLGTNSDFGLPARDYQMVPPAGISDKQESKIASDCTAQHSALIELYYDFQPAAQRAYLGKFEEQRDSILKCLKGLGYETDPQSTAKELLYRVSEAGMLEDRTCFTGSFFAGVLDPEREEEIMAEYWRRKPD